MEIVTWMQHTMKNCCNNNIQDMHKIIWNDVYDGHHYNRLGCWRTSFYLMMIANPSGRFQCIPLPLPKLQYHFIENFNLSSDNETIQRNMVFTFRNFFKFCCFCCWKRSKLLEIFVLFYMLHPSTANGKPKPFDCITFINWNVLLITNYLLIYAVGLNHCNPS